MAVLINPIFDSTSGIFDVNSGIFPPPNQGGNALLLENNTNLLLEDNTNILLEA